MRPPRLPSFSRPPGPSRRAAFTLVELLVAVGLTSIMLWGLLQLFTSATRLSATVSAESELCSATRSVLNHMSRELSRAVTLDVGYIKLTNVSADFDKIEFVAPIPEADGDVPLTHIRYDVVSGSLQRSTKIDQTPATIPSTYTTEARFGLIVERFNVGYVPASGGAPVYTSATLTQMPSAIVIELRARDPKGAVVITMSTSAPLFGGGM
jgi:type II secretory pathway pseudopilin PulG